MLLDGDDFHGGGSRFALRGMPDQSQAVNRDLFLSTADVNACDRRSEDCGRAE